MPTENLGLIVFISHSSNDQDTARALVTLLERALKLPAKGIRCTSVPGYKLPVGADTDEQLRREIFVARAFIGLLTPFSIESAYVLFELGARWGAKKHLAPVLANGADATFLRGPLSGLNALRLDARLQVLQLLEDLEEYLELELEPAASYQDAVDAVVALASVAKAPPSQSVEPSKPPQVVLSEHEVAILVSLSKNPSQTTLALCKELNVILEKGNYYVERLESLGNIDRAWTHQKNDWVWSLKQHGRAVLVRNDLL